MGMDFEDKKRDLLDIENSLVRLDEVISRQFQIIAELERDGHAEPAKLARSLLRQYEDSLLCARRDWLRKLLGRDYKKGGPNPSR
jgi:hypothetical protein